jgi:CheY-like chemotaxis protein
LVVDNNPQASELLTRHLAAGGFRVDIATTGLQALDKAQKLLPVAITLDILLPEIDGWEVLKRLKANPLTAMIPVVVVSVIDNSELAHSLGAIDFLVKPVDQATLLSSLSHYSAQLPSPKSAAHILIIDDEPGQIDLLDSFLVPAGFTTIRALRGREGINLARSGSPDLILLDLRMPGMSGFEVVEELRKDPLTESIPIIILTAKEISEAERTSLTPHVAAVFDRLNLANSDLLGWLHRLVDAQEQAKEQAQEPAEEAQ